MRSVLITGAYGGMGRATSKLLAKNGFRVFALDLNVEKEEENIIPIKADITSGESVREAFSAVSARCEGLYAIVHFAGIYMLDSLVELEEREFDRIFDVNMRGAYLVNKEFLPLLSRGGRILITTSELAPLDPLPFTGIYAVTKGALDKYAYSLRMELQLLGISVSVLRAGAVETGMLGVSTSALDRFCENTELYSCNARRFKKIVESVEAKSVKAEKIGKKTARILSAKRPKLVYKVNRNPLLLLLNILPKRLATFIIKLILK